MPSISAALSWMAVGAALYQAVLANAPRDVRLLVNDSLEGQGNGKVIELAVVLAGALLLTLGPA